VHLLLRAGKRGILCGKGFYACALFGQPRLDCSQAQQYWVGRRRFNGRFNRIAKRLDCADKRRTLIGDYWPCCVIAH